MRFLRSPHEANFSLKIQWVSRRRVIIGGWRGFGSGSQGWGGAGGGGTGGWGWQTRRATTEWRATNGSALLPLLPLLCSSLPSSWVLASALLGFLVLASAFSIFFYFLAKCSLPDIHQSPVEIFHGLIEVENGRRCSLLWSGITQPNNSPFS